MISSIFYLEGLKGMGDPRFLVGTGVPGVLRVLEFRGVLEFKEFLKYLEFREQSRSSSRFGNFGRYEKSRESGKSMRSRNPPELIENKPTGFICTTMIHTVFPHIVFGNYSFWTWKSKGHGT